MTTVKDFCGLILNDHPDDDWRYLFPVFKRLLTETGNRGVDIHVNLKMSSFDNHLKAMISEVLKPNNLVHR